MSASGVTAWLCFLSQHALYLLTVMTVLAEWVKMYAFNTTQGKKVDLLTLNFVFHFNFTWEDFVLQKQWQCFRQIH